MARDFTGPWRGRGRARATASARFPWPDAPAPQQVIEAAPDTGIVLDSWHFARGNLHVEPLRAIDPRLIVAVEINDLSVQVHGTMLEDTIDRRRLCGEGDYNVGAFLSAALASGYAGPIGVEILSTDLRAMSVEDAACASMTVVGELTARAECVAELAVGGEDHA